MNKISILLLLSACGYQYSDGTRIGTLYKFSKKGFFCKTWEGTLKTGYLTQNEQGIAAEEFKFSVEDDGVAQKIKELEGKKITIKYVQKIFNPPCSPDSDYRVVEALEAK